MSNSSHNSRVEAMNRRIFLRRSTAAAATAAVASTGANFAFSVDAFAAGLETLTADQGRLLLAVARAMFPHPTLTDDYYGVLVGELDEGAGAAPELEKTLVNGLDKLDRLAGGRWVDLSADKQEEVLENPELAELTGAVYGKALTAIYNNPKVWTQLGYEGPSAEQGGYINRGFNDLNWLDAPSEDASPKVA
ncbi:MAG: hypothetical protein ACR2RL_23395 [Gammaproteobacteria bacterium]